MQVLEGRSGKYRIEKSVLDYPYDSKACQEIFRVNLGSSLDNQDKRYYIKRLLFPSRLKNDLSKYVHEISKISSRKDITILLKLVDLVEKDNEIYMIQEYSDIPRLNEKDQIKEINLINILREIVLYYEEFNFINKNLSKSELTINELCLENILYDKETFNILLDNLNFYYQSRKMRVEPSLECTNVRSLGLLTIQLLFKRRKPENQSFKDFLKEEALKENGVKITNTMRNLIFALLSKNPPSWAELKRHPLWCPLKEEDPNYEYWKNEFEEDLFVEIPEKISNEEIKFNEITNYLIALDQINDVRIMLMNSEVMEPAVRMLFFLLLKTIYLHESFVKEYEKVDFKDSRKKNIFLKQIKTHLQDLKNYYSTILKKDYESYFKESQNQWFLKMNMIQFDLNIDSSELWIESLKKEIQEDIEKVFLFLEKEKISLAHEKKNFSALIKI